MVRGSDSYLNATQILKVAGFEKTRRSKILEREVLGGEHEKVQGGYGKYQGTWIPFEKGKELAEKYEVLDRMMPLLTFDRASISGKEKIPTKEQVQLEAKLQLDNLASHSPPHSPKDSIEQQHKRNTPNSSGLHQKKTQPLRKKMKLNDPTTTTSSSPDSSNSHEESFDEHHRNLLMNIFLSDNPDDTPTALASTLLTNDINIDLVIDEQGHTALHWAAALGRTKIVDLLISNGANVCSINLEGETPLMRAAMITCCYENKCFSHMVEMMSDAITVFDRKGRTILHHIALTADVDGYADAAIYYMKRLFKTAPKKIVLKNMLNIQDRFYGETALAIALRAGCPEISDYLTKQGASDPLLSNLEPDATVDFIPIDYKQNSKGPDMIASFHNQIMELEEHYQEQLRQRDIETFQTKKEMNMLRYQLNEAQRRLELPVSMQLAEAQKRIHELEHQKVICDDLLIGNELKQEQENAVDTEEKSTKERKLEKRIKLLQNQLESNSKTIDKLKADLEGSQLKAKQKEMEYRRLIAASCNLPIEKVDGLIGPLTLAIESDPPDLDMTRVIGFMERLRRPNTPHDSTTPV
ncbi:ankyrin repeat-containing domain protein [Pilaira anomala]|nr:ankyrin repeat-containing domain protein [Pilaira anomala]